MSLSTICLHQKHIWGLGPMLLELRSFFIRPDNPIHENKTSHFCLLWAATLNHRTRLTCNALNSQTSTATLRYIYVPLLIWMRCNLYWVLVKKKKIHRRSGFVNSPIIANGTELFTQKGFLWTLNCIRWKKLVLHVYAESYILWICTKRLSAYIGEWVNATPSVWKSMVW